MRKKAAILVIIAMIFTMLSGFSAPSSANEAVTFKPGDKVQFGSYLGEKLTWTVIDIGKDGDPLLFADSLIGSKAYDVPDYGNEKSYTWSYGSEREVFRMANSFEWGVCTIRDWLNSAEDDAQNIKYTKGVSAYNKGYGNFMGYYEGESGFLSPKNFSPSESDLIKSVKNKSYLIQYYKDLKEGGTHYVEFPELKWDIYEVSKGYENAYFREVSDKVFLLNTYEYIKAYETVGEDIVNSDLIKPAQELLQNNSNFTGKIKTYVLRDTCMYGDELVPQNILVNAKYGEEGYGKATIVGYFTGAWPTPQNIEFKHFGVRPACWIDASKIKSLGGLGITTYPYILNGTPAQTIRGAVNMSINGHEVKFIASSGAPFIDKASRTQVPLRVAMESYGATVSWNNGSKTAIVEKNGIKVEVPVGKNYIVVNGQNQTIDTSAQIVNGKTYLPIKPVIEALGGKVSWDQATKTVIISK